MLIFSVLFQFYRMIPEGNPRGACKIEDWGLESTWSTLQFYLVGASGHEVFSLKIFSLKWNLLHGQAVSSSTAPFLSLVAESTRLFMLQSIGGIGKSATS